MKINIVFAKRKERFTLRISAGDLIRPSLSISSWAADRDCLVRRVEDVLSISSQGTAYAWRYCL